MLLTRPGWLCKSPVAVTTFAIVQLKSDSGLVLGCELLRGQGFPADFQTSQLTTSGKRVTIPEPSPRVTYITGTTTDTTISISSSYPILSSYWITYFISVNQSLVTASQSLDQSTVCGFICVSWEERYQIERCRCPIIWSLNFVDQPRIENWTRSQETASRSLPLEPYLQSCSQRLSQCRQLPLSPPVERKDQTWRWARQLGLACQKRGSLTACCKASPLLPLATRKANRK